MKWTEEEEKYLRKNYGKLTVSQMARHLHRTPHLVSAHIYSHGLQQNNGTPKAGKNWSQEEKDYLAEKWGQCSVEGIAKHLQRSVSSVINKSAKLGLGPQKDKTDAVPIKDFMAALGRHSAYVTKMRALMKLGLPVIRHKLGRKTYYKIQIHEFWKWAETHRGAINWSKLEKNMLGKEPKWVNECRKMDYAISSRPREWTKSEDHLLIQLVRTNKTIREVTNILNRTTTAIEIRCDRLGCGRPVRGESYLLNKEETKEALRLRAEGYKPRHIAYKLGCLSSTVTRTFTEAKRVGK